MRAAALQPAAIGVGDQHLVDHVLAVAPHVALDHGRVRAYTVTDQHRMKELPLLLGVQVADQVGQVPRQVPVDLGVEEQRRCDGAAERRRAAIPRVAIVGAVAVHADQVGRDAVLVATHVAADEDVVLVVKCVCHVFLPDATIGVAARTRQSSAGSPSGHLLISSGGG